MLKNIKARYLEQADDLLSKLIILTYSDQIQGPSRYSNDVDMSKILRSNEFPQSRILRQGSEENESTQDRRERLKNSILVRHQHEKRMKELTDFMQNHMLSTKYFYEEMKRIVQQRAVKNDLRKMVDYLEKPGNSLMRKQVMDCFFTYWKRKPKAYDVWKHPTNNLIINIDKDPYNDGVIN